jgi:hypothetical protein
MCVLIGIIVVTTIIEVKNFRYYVVIFTSVRTAGDDGYAATARAMLEAIAAWKVQA